MPWSTPTRVVASLLVVAHFCCIGISYSANWQRSTLQDSVLSKLHPYVVTFGLYVEMLGVDWTTGKSSDALSSIEYHAGDGTGEWQELISNIGNEQQHRPRRLLRTLNALIEFEDTDGTCVVLQSLIERAVKQGAQIKRIRVVSVPDIEAGEKVVFEASVSKLENGRFVLLPRIDAYRTVPTVPAPNAVPPAVPGPAVPGSSATGSSAAGPSATSSYVNAANLSEALSGVGVSQSSPNALDLASNSNDAGAGQGGAQ